jgi:hypothetical protein
MRLLTRYVSLYSSARARTARPGLDADLPPSPVVVALVESGQWFPSMVQRVHFHCSGTGWFTRTAPWHTMVPAQPVKKKNVLNRGAGRICASSASTLLPVPPASLEPLVVCS